MKNIVHWLGANKISLNTKKAEIVLFNYIKNNKEKDEFSN